MEPLQLYLIQFVDTTYMTFYADDVEHAIQQAWDAQPDIPIVKAYYCDVLVDRVDAIEDIIDKVRVK